MIIVIRYIIYKDKYTKFNYFLDFKKIDFLFFVFIFYTHTHRERERERERERDFINNCYTIFTIWHVFKIFYNICFWKKKCQTWTYIIYIFHVTFFFFILIVIQFNYIIKIFLLSRASHGHNTSIYINLKPLKFLQFSMSAQYLSKIIIKKEKRNI